MRAFWELSSCRFFGAGSVGPIPWNRVVEYAERKQLEPCMLSLFEEVIRELDECYLANQREEQKKRMDR